MAGDPKSWRANPTAAVVVSVVVALMGLWMIRGSTSELETVFGWFLVLVGVLGGAANLYIRHRWRNPR